MKRRSSKQGFYIACAIGMAFRAASAMGGIPLPEHPRPDFRRPAWVNLNGAWEFRFDPGDAGMRERWFEGNTPFARSIQVPFPWGSALSGTADEADIAWYARSVTLPKSWDKGRVFLVIGASDWLTSVWLDGKKLGEHRGGYTPFEFEIPDAAFNGQRRLVIRVDDTPHPFKLEGKQGYGPARGIWQTPYLELRGDNAVAQMHFLPDIDRGRVRVSIRLKEPADRDAVFSLHISGPGSQEQSVRRTIPRNRSGISFDVPVKEPRLWTLEDPFLYQATAVLESGIRPDTVFSYFGMRKISVMDMPGTDFPYIALNDTPVYIQATLDQAYHPEGFYTFPDDAFMRDEILRSRRIGLNAMRIHVKIENPRKLYWADRLGMLILADVPNSWGMPDADMRRESEQAMRGMIARDFNHPSIFSWILFNETWGLFSGDAGYTADTQAWVSAMTDTARALDPTRLVEDNSPCNGDHVNTDINSWHAYLPGYRWASFLDDITARTFPGSAWNFTGGRKQGRQPLFNSECGNVWGYQGSTGDVDWSWDYHEMINAFRARPGICGWLYTEHHDVINEWNGYYRYDRSDKETGLGGLLPGMTLKDLHSPFYIAAEGELCRTVRPGSSIRLPLVASFMTDRCPGGGLTLRIRMSWTDDLGNEGTCFDTSRPLVFKPWMNGSLEPVEVAFPEKNGIGVLAFVLENAAGRVLARNFSVFISREGPAARDEMRETGGQAMRILRLDPGSFTDAAWSLKQWDVLGGLKVNGAGSGFFEYRFPKPSGLDEDSIEGCVFCAELAAKALLAKDRDEKASVEGDYMRGGGANDPALNRNAYPMTDSKLFPSHVRVLIDGACAGVFDLPDDPADHRGILSWAAQPRDGFLHEAGSYGWLVKAGIPGETVRKALRSGGLRIRLEVDESLPGGLAVYGEGFGRYPMDPSLVLLLKK
ncbi:glycoside hydrolase family 2 [bacterium]|nr:glycoside hydrolase family 2 [bacterium]